MICSDDLNLIEKSRRLKFHGLGLDAYDRKMQGRTPNAQVIEPGYKYNMTDIAASFGQWQLERLDEWYQRRIKIVNTYHKSFKRIKKTSN